MADKYEYLDEERKKLWAKLQELDELVKKKTSDFENDAKVAAQQATEFRNNSDVDRIAIAANLAEANIKLEEMRGIHEAHLQFEQETQNSLKNVQANDQIVQSTTEDIQSKSEIIDKKVLEIEKTFESKPMVDEKIVRLNEIFIRGDDYDSKLGALYKSITERKKEIDELYYKIFGYTETNEDDGTETKIRGLKDELDDSFIQTKNDLDSLGKKFIVLEESSKSKYDTFSKERNETFNLKLKTWDDNYQKIEKTITDLLPRALTTGLSYAYSEKKIEEIEENKRVSTTFKWAIGGLIFVSLIPLAFSIISINQGVELGEVILRVPRLVLAILPLYVPVLWVAYSANKKINLSKRLIEEYTHKEVLSKTFEGLSKQIGDIENKDISSDLRTKLLYNILEVNSENPGKLISDYNKSDHPLMDALDKSIKLTNAVSKLSKIPGFAKMTAILDKKSKEIIRSEEEKANAGLDTLKVDQ